MSDRDNFLNECGGVFEHSQWVAERAFDAGNIAESRASDDVHAAMCGAFRAASQEERLQVLRAHPDLAGKLAVAGELTEDSAREQAGAGLDRLTADEFAEFSKLNEQYTQQFGFPFIIAVKGLDKDAILEAFRNRIANSEGVEFATACEQVEKIARLRLEALFPKG